MAFESKWVGGGSETFEEVELWGHQGKDIYQSTVLNRGRLRTSPRLLMHMVIQDDNGTQKQRSVVLLVHAIC